MQQHMKTRAGCAQDAAAASRLLAHRGVRHAAAPPRFECAQQARCWTLERTPEIAPVRQMRVAPAPFGTVHAIAPPVRIPAFLCAVQHRSGAVQAPFVEEHQVSPSMSARTVP